jgi:4-carboxymuconolactone decarboxylase
MSAHHEVYPRRTPEDLSGDAARVLGKLRNQGGYLTVNRILANATRLFRGFAIFTGAALNAATLPRRTVEVTILSIAHHLELDYEWAEHVPMAGANGVTDEQIGAIGGGQPVAAPLFSDAEALASESALTLLDTRRLPDQLWERCRTEFGDEGALELLMITGIYGGLLRVVFDGLELRKPE